MEWIIEDKTDEILVYDVDNKRINYYYKGTLTVEGHDGYLILRSDGEEVLKAAYMGTLLEISSPSAANLKALVEIIHGYINTSAVPSTGNSSTTALAAAATFTGISESNNHPDVMCSCKTTQSGTLYFDFSNDNVIWDTFPTNGFTVTANIHEFHTAVKGPRHTRVRLVNNAGVSSDVRLFTYYGTFQQGNLPLNQSISADSDATLTRSVLVGATSNNEYVNVPVGLQGQLQVQPTDQYGFTADLTPDSELLVTNKIRLVGEIFDGATIDTNFWTTAVSVGTATIANSELILTSGTASPNFARLYSAQRAIWVSGTTNKFRTQMRIASSDDDVTCRFGIGWGASMPTITDGAYFKIVGSTISVNTMAATVETSVASGSFNGTYTAPTLTNLNTYEILYTLRRVHFLINNIIVHTATYSTTNWTSGTNIFHAFGDLNNTGVSAAIAYTFRMMNITRLGNMDSMPVYKHIAGAATTVCKLSGGFLHSVIVGDAGTLCTIYDNTAGSGTVIAVLDTSATSAFSIDYHCPFYNGLTLVTTGGGSDITVIYE